MLNIFIWLFTAVLILVSVFIVLVVLAQKAKTDGGKGAALGGGATEAAFGADTGNVLTGLTIKAAIAFFVLTFGLYLANIYASKHAKSSEGQLPTIAVPAAPAVAPTAPNVVLPTAVPAEAAKN